MCFRVHWLHTCRRNGAVVLRLIPPRQRSHEVKRKIAPTREGMLLSALASSGKPFSGLRHPLADNTTQPRLYYLLRSGTAAVTFYCYRSSAVLEALRQKQDFVGGAVGGGLAGMAYSVAGELVFIFTLFLLLVIPRCLIRSRWVNCLCRLCVCPLYA